MQGLATLSVCVGSVERESERGRERRREKGEKGGGVEEGNRSERRERGVQGRAGAYLC